ncbi:MAG TPA: CoA transferase [Burkholderiales bacterium]|nr:CoA transferase [Burkholderiales bacterium]
MTTTPADGPLGGVRILDLTSVIMGPFATHILADLGADVIKVESPQGDSLRHHEPLRHVGMSGSFLNLHRNKRSVVLDLKQAPCRAALNRLVETADVFVHSLRPKTIERLGYGYDQVRKIKPDIVYCGACGFGAKGPYSDKPAYDDAIQAGSGTSALLAEVQGEPAYVPTVVCDKLSGQAVAYAILAALFQRARGGGGQAIEVPMLETSIEFNLAEHIGGSAFVPPLGEPGYTRLLSRRRKPYRTQDGYACILPYSDRNWQDFYRFTGRTEFAADPRFRRLTDRVENIAILYEMIQEEAPKRTTAQWVAFCDRVSIPCMPVLSLADLPDDPHVKAVGLFGTAEHPSEGRYRTVRNPVSFSAAPFRIRRHAPRLGEHTAEVLAEAGLSSQQIEEVRRSAAVAPSDGADPKETTDS